MHFGTANVSTTAFDFNVLDMSLKLLPKFEDVWAKDVQKLAILVIVMTKSK
jgi:hypothetical protein